MRWNVTNRVVPVLRRGICFCDASFLNQINAAAVCLWEEGSSARLLLAAAIVLGWLVCGKVRSDVDLCPGSSPNALSTLR